MQLRSDVHGTFSKRFNSHVVERSRNGEVRLDLETDDNRISRCSVWKP